jgi:hypothetical protein
MIVVSEIFQQVGRVLGNCDQDYVFDVITQAVELLANKPTRTNVLWDPMLIYCDVPIVESYYLCLPNHLAKPVKVNLNKQPSFSRNQFYEFSMNGPGSNDPESGWQWTDKGWRALQKPWPPGGSQLMINSDNSNDLNMGVLVHVVHQDGSAEWVTAYVGQAYTQTIFGILEASKPVTEGNLTVYASPYIIPSKAVAVWEPQMLSPEFQWIKLSQAGVSARILARRKTYKITQLSDLIPLSNRLAVITACLAIRALQTLNWDDASAAEQNAMRFLDEDQAARNLYARVSNVAETSPTLNLNIGTRDSIIVADLYDTACDIFGPIGQQKIFDRITESIELLANMSNWDATIGYCDIQTFDSFYVTLPQYVDNILAINVNHTTGAFRNQWFEFNMDGLGQDNDQADLVGSNRPCGGWEEVGESPVAFPFWQPSYIAAYPFSEGDTGCIIRAYGIDINDLPVYSLSDRQLGVKVTCEQNNFDISDQALPFKRIDRIVLGDPQSFISLYATDGTAYGQSLGVYWPNIREPKFRIIKIGQKAVAVRIRYRKRLVKITSLTDPIHMRSRSAMFHAMRAVMTAATDPNAAALLLQAAKDLLNKEWRATHPHEELGIQIDPSTWGGSMITMP